MIINGIDFDKRLDYAKQWNFGYIDCLFDCQSILDKEGPRGTLCDPFLKAIAVVQRTIQFTNRPIYRIHPSFESGSIHKLSAGDAILTPQETRKLLTSRL